MKLILVCFLLILNSLFLILVPPPAGAQASRNFIIDHNSVALFDQIPDQYRQAAANLHSIIRHASIGGGLSDALTCLQNAGTQPVCRTVTPGAFNRANFTFQNRGNPAYSDKIDDFVTTVRNQAGVYDIFMFKFCFIDYGNQTCYGCTSTFDRLRQGYADAQAILTQYNQSHSTSKRLIWWTLPLTRYQSIQSGDALNTQIRTYVRANNLTLFDIADIESHDYQGNWITDSSGREIAWEGYCSEGDTNIACHPTYPNCNNCTGCAYPPCDGGITRIAKAWWVMMAQFAGWVPTGSPTNPPASPTPIRTPTPVRTPTPTLMPGDFDLDQDRDWLDWRSLLTVFGSQNPPFNLIGTTGLIDIFDVNWLARSI